jgi:hypothetical protein
MQLPIVHNLRTESVHDNRSMATFQHNYRNFSGPTQVGMGGRGNCENLFAY